MYTREIRKYHITAFIFIRKKKRNTVVNTQCNYAALLPQDSTLTRREEGGRGGGGGKKLV